MSVDLELASAEELLEELFNRKTFAGVIVYSKESHKYSGQLHKNLTMRKTCDDESAAFLLQEGVKALINNFEEET